MECALEACKCLHGLQLRALRSWDHGSQRSSSCALSRRFAHSKEASANGCRPSHCSSTQSSELLGLPQLGLCWETTQNPLDRGQSRKIRFSKFPGSGLIKIKWTLCFAFFPAKNWQNAPKIPGLVNQFSATPRGQLNWTGPVANGSEPPTTLIFFSLLFGFPCFWVVVVHHTVHRLNPQSCVFFWRPPTTLIFFSLRFWISLLFFFARTHLAGDIFKAISSQF